MNEPAPPSTVTDRFDLRSLLLLILLTAGSLLLFIDKAFHIDDPIFLWPAQALARGEAHPLNHRVNWYGFAATLLETTNHPLLHPLILSLTGRWFGFTERVMHGTVLPFSVGAIVGAFLLARELGARPALAALLILTSPAFFVSATNVMCDVPMLCWWTGSVFCWTAARNRDRPMLYLVAGLLAAAATMTKYPGIFLVLLLMTQFGKRRRSWQIVSLLLPVAALLGWEWFTRRTYGSGAVSIAFSYAAGADRWAALPTQWVTGLSFMGGCYPVATGFLFITATRRARWTAATVAALFAAILFIVPVRHFMMEPELLAGPGLLQIHLVAFCVLAVMTLVLGAAELLARPDRTSLLIACWIAGIFIFASVLNWTTNARSFLPMAPAMALLCSRSRSASLASQLITPILIALTAAVSFGVAQTDSAIADSARLAATRYFANALVGRRVWFTGHWGFQWYMEQRNATPVDANTSTLRAGDLLVERQTNSNPIDMPPGTLAAVKSLRIPIAGFVSPQPREMPLSFYSSIAAPIPYEFGYCTDQRFFLSGVTQNILPPSPTTAAAADHQ